MWDIPPDLQQLIDDVCNPAATERLNAELLAAAVQHEREFLLRYGDTMATGVVKCVMQDRGFGFISRDDGEDDLWFHMSQLVNLEFGEQLRFRRVQFDTQFDERSQRTRAVNIRPAN